MLFVSFCLGIGSALAQIIQNSSFEEDTFTNYPGYTYKNKPITGWNSFGGTGLNPGKNFSPFTDNGAIVSGEKIAFLQNKSSLSQVVKGFEPGSQYTVWFFENARSGNAPILSIKVGDITVMAPHIVTSVGGNEPYHSVISPSFTATASSLQLSFINSAMPDNTVFIDNVSIAKVGGPLIPEQASTENLLLVYEGFEYPDQTDLNTTQARGTGWLNGYAPDTALRDASGALVTSSSLNKNNLTTAGNKIITGNRGSLRYLDLDRFPARLKTGTVVRAEGRSIWLSVLGQKEIDDSNGLFGVSLYYNTNQVLFWGADKNDSQWRIGGAGGSVGLSGISAHEKALLVVRIDWNDDGSGRHPDMAYLWVNPNINQPILHRETATAICARLDQFAFNRVGFRGKSKGSLDEFRIGATFRSVVPLGQN